MGPRDYGSGGAELQGRWHHHCDLHDQLWLVVWTGARSRGLVPSPLRQSKSLSSIAILFQSTFSIPLPRHRGNTYLTLLPLVSVRRHGRVTRGESRDEISPRVQVPLSQCTNLMLRRMHLTNLSENIEAKHWVSWLLFDVQQAWIWAMKSALELIILCSNRWLKIKVTARKKAYFRGVPRRRTSFFFLVS